MGIWSFKVINNILFFIQFRAIGVTKSQSYKIYLYEAIFVIIAAFIMGTCIGLASSSTIASQMYMFAELPFELIVR